MLIHRSSTKRSFHLLNLAALSAALFFLTSCDFFSKRILTKPVVQVESKKLTAKEFSSILANKLKDLDALAAKDPRIVAVHRDQIINDFIVTEVINLWLEENKITITPEEVEAESKKISSSYPTDSSFKEALSEAGLTYAEWTKKNEDTIKKKKLFAHLKSTAPPVTDAEYLSFYESNKALYEQKEGVLFSHIQVADENQAEIVLKLLKKQKFEDVAMEYSAAYRSDSGDAYGWVEKGFMVELDKAFKLNKGAILGPVKIGESIHVFKIMDKKPFKQRTFAEAKAQVEADVNALREKAQFATWLDDQFKRYSIKKNRAVIESIKVETQQ